MRYVVAIAALTASLAASPCARSAFAGLEIQTETSFPESSETRTRSGRMLLDGNRLRMEMPGQDSADGRGLTLIFRGDLGVVYILDEKDRSYAQMDRKSAEQMRAKIEGAKKEMQAQMGKLPPDQRLAMEKMLAEQGFGDSKSTPPPPEIHTAPTDRSATVGSFACREYDVLEGKKKIGDACVASWADTETTRDDFDALRDFAAFEDEMSKAMAFGGQKRAGGEMTRLFDLGGVPVQMRAERDGKVVSETRTVAIKKLDLPADTFSPPSGWTKRNPGKP